ncbi:MAG: hypothetical protein HFF30_09830 [Flavonifractor sp.]|jgi:prophage antirepressor-like protein|nr:hypothetical protein [Flavonifractor sp.]
MNGLQVFSYNSSEVRTVMRDGEPWFCLKDVCAVLGISKYRDVAARLDPDEREPVRVDTLGGTQEMVFINESGLYSVILRSDKPEAKPFRKWVTSDVLPTIRKTGRYGLDDTKAALAEAKLNNSRARVASAWMKISKENPVSGYKQVCAHYASAALAGREVLPLPDTECCAVAGKDAASAWAVMDELMETLRVVKQRTYDSVMRKMERL